MNSKAKHKKQNIFNPAMVGLSVILQIIAINSMMVERGNFQFGGEWLIIPLFLLLNIVFEEAAFQIKKEVNSLLYEYKKYKNSQKSSAKRTSEKAKSQSSKPNYVPNPSIRMIKTDRRILKPTSKQYMHAS